MENLKKLNARRNELVGEIAQIKSMRKGTVNVQYKNVKHKTGEVFVRGPYYVLTKKENGKTVTQNVTIDELAHITEEADNYKRFRQLSDEFVEVCENISILIGSDETAKKN